MVFSIYTVPSKVRATFRKPFSPFFAAAKCRPL